MHHLAQIRATGKTSAPVNVEIDLSNRCSRGCTWCHFAYTHTRGPLAGTVAKPAHHVDSGDLMDEHLAYEIIDQLVAQGVRSITWTGGGEPTLHPQFDNIIAYAQASGIEQGLYTLGGHIGDYRAGLLKRALTWVYISLDAHDPESYKRDKGVNGFAPVLEGISNLVAADGPATIGVGFLIHRGNMDDIWRMVALGRGLGVDYVQFRPTIRYNMARPNEVDEPTGWTEQAMRWLRAYDNDPFVIADVDRFGMYGNWAGHGYRTCYWAALQTVITPNGKVWRCVNKRERSDALLGDLEEESFGQIWERAGGTCAVDGECRVMCRGHVANITLDEVLTRPAHAAFI